MARIALYQYTAGETKVSFNIPAEKDYVKARKELMNCCKQCIVELEQELQQHNSAVSSRQAGPRQKPN